MKYLITIENFEDIKPFKYGEYMLFEKDYKHLPENIFILSYVVPKSKGGDIIIGNYAVYASCSHRSFNESGDVAYSYRGLEYMFDKNEYLLNDKPIKLLWRGKNEKEALEMINSLKISKKFNL